LTRKESRTILEEIAKRFFGRALAVEVVKAGAAPAPEASASPTPVQPQAGQGENDPLVKTVLDVLGGEVQTPSRSYRSPG